MIKSMYKSWHHTIKANYSTILQSRKSNTSGNVNRYSLYNFENNNGEERYIKRVLLWRLSNWFSYSNLKLSRLLRKDQNKILL